MKELLFVMSSARSLFQEVLRRLVLRLVFMLGGRLAMRAVALRARIAELPEGGRRRVALERELARLERCRAMLADPDFFDDVRLIGTLAEIARIRAYFAAPGYEDLPAQSKALDAFVVDGIRHNIPFLSALMAHPRWKSGKLSTGFIAEEFPDGFHAIAPKGAIAETIAAVAAAIDHVRPELATKTAALSVDLSGDNRPQQDGGREFRKAFHCHWASLLDGAVAGVAGLLAGFASSLGAGAEFDVNSKRSF